MHKSFLAAVMTMATTVLAAEDMSGWYPFEGKGITGKSVIGMEDWLDKPAGVQGPVKMVGDRFEVGGKPIKFWGVNVGSGDCAPEKELGTRWAAWNAKYGVNCVRLHKFVGTGGTSLGDPQDSTKYVPENLDNFDHFCNQLKQQGVYFGFSWIFEHKVRPADKAKLLAYDEIVAAGGDTHRLAVFIAEDVQNLRLEMLANLLKHKNPYTGMTYAQDPALAFIELQNEDSIFFYTFQGLNKLETMPTYKNAFLKRFSEFLRKKYGSHEKLVAAWGEKAMNILEVKDEQLDKGNIAVQGNPWFFSPEGLAAARGNGSERRMLDTAEFLYRVQTDYYARFEKTVRDAGYEGPLVGSCWTTPAGVPAYLNLHTDYQVGFIDRHNYFGGLPGWRPAPGKFGNNSQLDKPGTGLLSIGMQQVADRPFAFSEWTTVFPNEWVIESPSIIAAYGMGLQGWDGSYAFASHVNEYEGRLWALRTSEPRLWVISTPHQMGLYPALSRMILRGDVKQGDTISTRRVSVPELLEGKPEFVGKERAEQAGDFKEFAGLLPNGALAAGRVVVEFTDEPKPSEFPKIADHVREGAVISTTNQLTWYPARDNARGYFTINTEGTKAAIGFLPKQPIDLGGVTIQSPTPFAGIYLTSLERDRTLKDSRQVLVTAIARVRNTGQQISDDGAELLAVGTAPMLIEPVIADIQIAGRKITNVRLLTHEGELTDKVLPVGDGKFTIDGQRDRTFYYLVELQ